MKKITLSIAFFALSFSCLSQTESERRQFEGGCYQSAMEKASRTGLSSVDKNLMKWVATNFDTANRVEALSRAGGKCVGKDNNCFKSNLSQSDYDFGMGMAKAMALLNGPQDPAKLPNLEVGLMYCFLMKKY